MESFKTPVNIRWWQRPDMTQMLTLEGFNEKSFLDMLVDRDTICMVATKGDMVVGYMVYEIYRGGITLLDLVVHTDWRKQDIGTQMILKLLQRLDEHSRTHIKGIVNERKLRVQQWLRRVGFKAINVERGWFDDGFSDGFVFILRWQDIQKSFFMNFLTEIIPFNGINNQEMASAGESGVV